LDKSEPVSAPAADTPPPRPAGVGGWFLANLMPLAFVAAIVGVIIWRDLDIWPVVLAVLGLGLVIFIHELGHFLAAKFCDVHVETFSIGFGKAIPGCQFRRGETLYKIGWIPLGGYVKMVGEGENADSEEADEDPRSFKNKSVGQRMVIISAGVIMNLILGCACFMVAYSHGVEETPAIIGTVGTGSPAWQEGLAADMQIVQIGTYTRPTFDDIRPKVMSAAKGDAILFKVRDRAGNERDAYLVPRRNPEELYPMVGINPVQQLVLQKMRKASEPPVLRQSPAFRATAAQDHSRFQGGDRIIGTSFDPANPAAVKPLPPDPRAGDTKLDATEFFRNLHRMRGKPMTVVVDRKGTALDFVLEPAWTQVLPGVRLQMGRLAALRVAGPAAKAAPVGAPGEEGLKVATFEDPAAGDKIIEVAVTAADGSELTYVDVPGPEKKGVKQVPFNPLKLGYDLEVWAESAKDLTVRVTVLRAATLGGPAKTGRRVTFEMKWDPALVNNGEASLGTSAPIAISGLGLAYYVDATVDAVDPAAASPLAKGDVITGVRPQKLKDNGEATADDWRDVKQYQGVALHELLQGAVTNSFDLRVTRGGATTELTVNSAQDSTWPAVDRGFAFPFDTRLQQADNVIDALEMGLHRTWRTVQVIYQTLYATIFRQISAKTMSGPLSIANASYKIAGYDLWQFIIFIGLININLAVVNFLPIPLLDGGHMVFLIYEKVRGKPAPEKLQEWSMWVGLALILALMAFVIFLDVRKLFF
jgi:regulator of sigma E protease